MFCFKWSELMDKATNKQKSYIRHLFKQCGVPDWVFRPAEQWKINKEGADSLTHNLKVLFRHHSGDLKDHICQEVCDKNIVKVVTKTVDQIEEVEEPPLDKEFPETWRDQLEFYDIDPGPEPFRTCHLQNIQDLKGYMEVVA